MTPKMKFYENQAESIIRNLKKRNMEGYYCPTREEAVAKALSFIQEGSLVSFGGSMTLSESGMMDALKAGSFQLIDRALAKNPEELKDCYRRSFLADTYVMSTNAITMDGKLVNIDGNGNRAAALIYGPEQVSILCGMNKVCKDEAAAISRAHETAAPMNALRLSMDTPCAKTGSCADCLSKDCICAHTVITRYNRMPGRIKVILVGEALGY